MSYKSKLLHLTSTVQFRLPSPRGHVFPPQTFIFGTSLNTSGYTQHHRVTHINYSVPEINGFKESNKKIDSYDGSVFERCDEM